MKWFFSGFLSVLFFIPIFCNAQQSKIDSLEAIVQLNQKDLETVKSLNYLAIEYSRTDVDKSKKYLWKAKFLLSHLNNQRTQSSTYSQLALIYQNQAILDSANYYLSLLKELAVNSEGLDSNIIKGNYNSTAGLINKKRGNVKEALPFFINAYEIANQNGDVNSASGQAINIGNSYLGLSDFNKALNYYLKALQGFEQTENKKGQSFCYQNIGECYIELSRYSEALTYVNKSIKLKTEMQDKRGLGNAEQSLGRIYLGLENYDKAFKHYSEALEICKELKLTTEEVKIYLSLGQISVFKEETDKALGYYKKSKELGKKLGDSTSVYTANLEILAINEAKTNQDVIEANALESIQSLKENGVVSKEAAGYKNLAEFYEKQKKYDKALEYTNLYHTLTDSIRNSEIQTQFKSIEEQFNKANNEKQIALLQKDQIINSEKLKQQRFLLILSGIIILFAGFGIWNFVTKSRLKQRIKEIELRNQIASDLHDEVGSSLSSIYMLSQMASQDHFQDKKSVIDKVVANAEETIDKMGDIVWMLKPSNNYSEGLFERMRNYINDISMSKNIEYSFNIQETDFSKLTMQQSKNLYLILKEAVNNAVKYSHTQKLDVQIKLNNNSIHMSINDYGIGFEENAIDKGNGMDNMKSRAKEINGKLKIMSVPKKGTTIDLSFPLS